MGSFTTRTGKLWKPVAGDSVNVTTDINNNMDNLDTYAMGFAQVTNAAARPTTVWPGLCIFQTADSTTWVSNGSAPASSSWINIPNGASSSAYTFNLAATTTDAVTSKITTDTTNRYVMNADGSMEWGPGGAAATDTTLYRSTGDTLKTDDSFVATRNISVGGNASVGGGVGVLGLINATTAPTADPSGGVIAYSSSGQLTTRNATSLVQRINGSIGLSPASFTLSTFTTETVVASITLPANEPIVGATYRIRVWGVASTTGTPQYQFRNRVNWVNSGSPGTQAATTGALTTASGIANRPWMIDAHLVCLTAGATGSFFTQLNYHGCLTTGAPPTTPEIRFDGAAAASSIDTTTATTWALTVSCNTSSASNSVVVRGSMCERVA